MSQQQGDTHLIGERLSAGEIFGRVARTGEEELKRDSAGLALSGFASGLSMGLTGLGSAILLAVVGPPAAHPLVAAALYPLGFIVVVLGRAQLFTENTLYPVIVVLDRRGHLRNMLRLWAVVFVTNVAGAAVFAALMDRTSALPHPVLARLEELGTETVAGGFSHLFWSAVVGGWIIAMMAWLVAASQFSMGQITLIYLLTFVVGAGKFAHCIAGSGEALTAVMAGRVPLTSYLAWLGTATLGNTLGGVFIVSLLNYGQVVGSTRIGGSRGKPPDHVERG
jgi:formate-nitrite transporter family protein